MKNRAYMSKAENRERKNRRQLGRDWKTDPPRSPESKARARERVRAKNALLSTTRSGSPLTEEDLLVIFSDLPAVAVAALVERSPQAIYHMRSRARKTPDYVPRGTAGRGPRWSAAEDAFLVANKSRPGKWLAASLGRSHDAVRLRKSVLRRRGLIG